MSSPPSTLGLHEEILLLALRDEAGTIEMGSLYQYAIGGAALAELLLRERIGIEGSGKKRLVRLRNAKPIGEALLDECLERIRDAKRPAAPDRWVARFAGLKQLRDRVARGLCRRGVLRADEEKLLLIFSRETYPEVDPEPERRLVERLRDAIFGDARDLDPRTVVLVSLAKSADLLKAVFDKRELKGRQARMEQIIQNEATGRATKKAIEAVQAALMVATVVPVVVTTSSH